MTHDPNVAAHADRIIRIRDGLVFDDDCLVDETTHSDIGAENGETAGFRVLSPTDDRSRDGASNTSSKVPREDMRFFVRTTVDGSTLSRRNAMRSALTMLGIIIGVGSLLAIAEIGNGAWSAIRAC